MKKSILALLLCIVANNTIAQNTATKALQNKNGQQSTTQGMPERRMPLPTKNNWKSLPQFQVQKEATRWYALENENNPVYWANVKTDRILICLKTGVSESVLKGLIDKYNLQATSDKSMFPAIANFFIYAIPNANKSKMLQIIKDAQHDINIEYAEPSVIYSNQLCYGNDPYLYPNTSSAPFEWSMFDSYADSAWCYVIGVTGTNSNMLAIIDDAVDYTHPDLGFVGYGYDYADNDNDPAPDATINQTHGTHVTGIASAITDNGIGVAGMANDTVFFAKISKSSNGQLDDIAIVNALNAISISTRIKSINMSFGAPVPSSAIQNACNNAWNSGKVLVAASGNNGTDTVMYPAAYSSVIAVASATNTTNYQISSFSSFGTQMELTAFGGDNGGGNGEIYSTLPNNTYGYKSGTSMAAPMVTGLANLMFDINPALTNAQVRTILQQSVWDEGAIGWDIHYGYGVICAVCAVLNAQNYVAPSSIEEVTSNDNSYVYPNPNNGVFTIDTGCDNAVVSIYNLVGEQVWTKAQTDKVVVADISSEPNGIYFARICNGKNQTVKKIIINH